MQVKDDKELSKKFDDYVKEVTKSNSLLKNMINAFIVGGCICAIAQIIYNIIESFGIKKEHCNYLTIIILVGTAGILTGLNIYKKIGKIGGAGSLVPITGFANSVSASAIEFKAEGMIMGMGCKIFTIAGPVILYGILSSMLLGVLYYLWSVFM